MPKMITEKILRVALYPRVSTDEQVLHGYSLDQQEKVLVEYAKAHGYKIVGIYRDEGHSARKAVTKRDTMKRLLEDVAAGKIDLILFTKLDRWFRNVAEYHTVQAVLDKYNVPWKAILEDYQTETADGRLKVNIMLSVAENEADRTSERIKFVFDGRVQRGEWPYGGRSPYGYKVAIIDGVRRLVKDEETAPSVTAFWENFQKYESMRRAILETNREFGLMRSLESWKATLRNEVHSGEFQGVKNYCEPYVSREVWERLQRPELRVKATQKNRTYLFVGLIRCPVCGSRLSAVSRRGRHDKKIEYFSYRCTKGTRRQCEFNYNIPQIWLEKYLVQNISTYFDEYATNTAVSAQKAKAQQKTKSSVDKLNEKLRRLNNIYMAGNITDSEYTKQAAELKAEIAKAETQQREERKPINLDAIRKLLNSNFEELYYSMDMSERQRFWRSIIKQIHVGSNKRVTGIDFRA